MKNNPYLEREKRAAFAYMLATNPETFEMFTKNNVILFHGTNSNALPNILKYGINSVDELSKIGITVSTGEEWSRISGKRDFISLTDNLDIALNYASMSPKTDKSKESSFGVLIGVSTNDINKLKTCVVDSDLPEIGIRDTIPLECIKVIAVPENKVDFVRKLVNDEKILVTSIDMGEKFYNIDPEFGDITFDPEKAEELVLNQHNKQEKSQNLNTNNLPANQNIFSKFFNKIRAKFLRNRNKVEEITPEVNSKTLPNNPGQLCPEERKKQQELQVQIGKEYKEKEDFQQKNQNDLSNLR